MTEKKWAFDRERLLHLVRCGDGKDIVPQLMDEIQQACEAHAREKVKSLLNYLSHTPGCNMTRWPDTRYCSCGFEAALKKRGIES